MPVEDCTVCGKLSEILANLKSISFYIGLSASKKQDFGLFLSTIQDQELQILRLMGYHEDYHRGGEKPVLPATKNAVKFNNYGKKKKHR
jgi:hypothetical protein